MSRLSEKQYWDAVYQSREKPLDTSNDGARKRQPLKSKGKIWIKNLLGKKLLGYMFYRHHSRVFWDVILKNHLPDMKGTRMLEVGCAPGTGLVTFNQRLDCVPYGIDYSEQGVEASRQAFIANNLNPDNAIHADFFSDEFHAKYKESFDMVYSGGFIEHFTDARDVVNRHVSLLAKGGYLVIIIPNLRGIYNSILKIFYKELLDIHNLNIMRKDEFAKLFDNEQLTPLLCDYYGTLTLDVVAARKNSPIRFLLNGLKKLELITNLIFHIVLRGKDINTRFTSPYLIFVGVKK
ncbi:MAG TPA: class I SAM-dependent methyltransferase [Blastocatellia bacterium]|nr:class I SAM-dependent methyltransferase [Blastocatellia bacterium]